MMLVRRILSRPAAVPGSMQVFLARLLLLGLSVATAWSQVTAGTIIGLVQDPSGAAVPNAAITLTKVDTGESRETRTSNTGEFNAPFVPTGNYTIKIVAPGFQTKTLTGIGLLVDQTVNLHISLEIGSVNESVEVKALAPLVESATSSLGQVIQNKEILDMPLNGRNPFALGLLSGDTTQVFGMGSNLPFIAGGGRFSAVDVSLDGVDNNEISNAGSIGRNGIAVVPSVDAIEEFKVKTNNFAAEYGHAAGSIVSATLKSGSNQFRGVVFEFLRNDDLDANNFFTNAAGKPRAPYHQNQFGGVIGGPIKHNRTFFFADYQGTRQNSVSGSTISDIPPASFRGGNFSQSSTTIYDPNARHIGPAGTVISTPYPNNTIPQSELNPTSLAILSLLPLPNFGSPTAVARNYFYQAPQSSNTDQGDVRIDQIINSKNNLFGSFSISDNFQPAVGNFPGFIGGGSSALNDAAQATLTDIHIFTPLLVNELRLGYIRHNGSLYGTGQEGVAFAQKAGLPLFPSPDEGFPSINFIYSGGQSGSAEFTNWGGGDPNLNIETRLQLADNISWTHGAHALKFGADIRRERFDTLKGTPFFGETIFGAIFTSSSNAPNSGLPFADYLLGDPAFIEGSPMLNWGRQRDLYAGGYAQDDWKINSRLILNLGLRYELYTQPVDAGNLGSLFNLTTGQYVIPGSPGYSRAIVQGDHNNWGPRFGFAYQAISRFVVRGGYGIFYSERDQNQQVTQFSGNPPNVPTLSLPNVSATQTVSAPFTINTPIVTVPTDVSLASFTPSKPYVGTFRTQSFNNARDPMLHQFNLDLQYQANNTLLLEASYSGAIGRDLATLFLNENQVPFSNALNGTNIQADRPYPNINGSVLAIFSSASSDYNALNLKLEKRLSAGLNILANYTWQKNMESGGSGPDAYTQNGGTSITLDTYNLKKERSVAPIDVPQTFTASVSYELPFGQQKRYLANNRVVDGFVGGWVVNGILTLRGGFPTDIRTNVLPPVFNTFNVASCASGVSMYDSNPGVNGFFNPAAFYVPNTTVSSKGAVVQEFGNCARRVAFGPGSKNLDFSLFKNFHITEHKYLQVRGEFFNATNTPTFYLPAANSPTLTCTGTPGSPCNAANSSFGQLSSGTATGRQIQIAMKFYF